jgi:tetratricopeptide (TPR) repeat protein
MLVRASLVSALLLALAAESGAQEKLTKTGSDAGNRGNTPEKGRVRAPTVEDLFGPAREAEGPAAATSDADRPDTVKVIRSARDRVDESGLRYFAAQNNQKRVDKEIQRLKALYPDWTPPDDLFLGPVGGPEEQPFWDLFAKDKMRELRAAIAEKMRAEPKWRPSPALVYKIERKENRMKLVAAYEGRQWARVIEIAAGDPKIMTCGDVDVQWRVGDAFAATQQKQQTFEIYRYILANCRDKAERLTTLKKSLAHFEPKDIDILIAMGARAPDGTGEFDAIRIDVLRIRLGRAASSTAEKLTPQDIVLFEKHVLAATASADAALLGWYRLAENQPAVAEEWFRQALGWPLQKRDDGVDMETQPKMAEGRILALKALDRLGEAEELALHWSPKSDAIRALYVDIVGEALARLKPDEAVSDARLSNYAVAVSALNSKFGAQALGWYQYNRRRWPEAIGWFQSALAWPQPAPVAETPGKLARPQIDDAAIAEGLALAFRAAARPDEAEDLAYAWREKSPRLAALYIDTFAETLAKQAPPQTVAEARITRFVDMVEAAKSIPGATALAWYHHDRAGWPEAIRWFRTAMAWSPNGQGDEKLAEGYAQSLRQDKQFLAAADVAYAWRDSSAILRALYVDITADHLALLPVSETLPSDRMIRFSGIVTADRLARGASAIAWYHYARKGYADALLWFKQGIDYGPEAAALDKMREGYVLTLRYAGDPDQAEDLAYDWRATSDLLRNSYFDVVAETMARLKPPAAYPEARLKRFIALVTEAKSSFGGQAIGWYLHQRGDHREAAEWFGRSIEWGGGVTDPKSAQGYLLALIALGRMEDADRLAFEWHAKSDEFRTLYIDTFGGAILSTAPPKVFAEQLLKRFEHITGYDRSVYGSQAVAWYYYHRHDWDNAARWFEASLTWSDPALVDQKTVEGFAQSIRYLGRREEAEDLLYTWRDRNPLLRRLYIELVSEGMVQSSDRITFSDERIDRFAAVVLADRSAKGAEGLAWYRHDRRHWPDSVRWFKYAREWSDDAARDPKTAEGLATALRNLNLYDESEAISVQWKDRNPTLRRLYIATVGEHLVRLKADFIYPNDRLERFLETVALDHDSIGAQSAGWYYHTRDTFETAAQWFWAALQWGPDAQRDPATAEGYISALRKTGKLGEAEAAAWEWLERSPSFERLYVDIAGEVVAQLPATETMPNERLGRLAALTTKLRAVSGANGLAWYHQAREEYQPASYWFERVIEWGGEVQDIRAVEGYIRALIGLGRYDEAETLAFKWRQRSDSIADLYITSFGAALLRAPKDSVLPPERLARYQLLVGEEKSGWGAGAMGWYFYERSAWSEASRWFETALAFTKEGHYDGKIVEAFSQSIRYLARREEAEEHLYPWRDRIPALRKLYIELFAEGLVSQSAPIDFSDERLDRYAAIILADRNSFGAQALAWYRHDRRQWPDAVRWFKYAREWSEDGKGDAKMAEGLAFSLRNLELYDESELVSVEWKERAPAVRRLYLETAGEYLVRLNAPNNYPDERMQVYAETTSADHNNIAAQSAGWYYFERKNYDAAADWFAAALQWGPDAHRDPKTAEGYVAALRLAGRLDEAVAAAFDLRDRSPALRASYFDVVAELLAALQPPAEWPTLQLARLIDLTMEARSAKGAIALGWYHQARANWREATTWFERALAWNGTGTDPKIAEAMIIALTGLGRYEEAENFVHLTRAENPDAARIYIDVFAGALLKLPVDQLAPVERLSRFTIIAGLEKSVFGAQAMGWYFHQRKHWDEAIRWFETSLAWAPAEGRDPKTIEGLAQAFRHAGRRDDAEELLFQWRGQPGEFRRLYIETFAEALTTQTPPLALSESRITRFAAVVDSERSQAGAEALGWYRLGRKGWADALRWFKAAQAWSPEGRGDAKIAEGAATALRALDRYDEAEAEIWDWQGRSADARTLYIDLVAEYLLRLKDSEQYPAARLARYQTLLNAVSSAHGAQALGWYALNRQQNADAVEWFRKALEWSAGDSRRDVATAEGLIHALRRVGDFDAAETLAFEWSAKDPRFGRIYAEVAQDMVGRTGPADALGSERLSRLVAFARASKSPLIAQAIGWYKLARSDWADAAEWFKQAMEWQGATQEPKTIEGYAIALRNLNRLDEAEALALAWKDKGEAFQRLYLDTVVARLAALKPADAYPADRLAAFAKLVHQTRYAAGAKALGWYKLARKQFADGDAWFVNAAAWGGTADEKVIEGRALALRSQQKFAEAEALTFEWRDKSDMLGDLYRLTMVEQMVKTKPPAALPADRLAKFAEHTQAAKSTTAAQALAWYAYDRKDWSVALEWFKLSSSWNDDPKDTKAAQGYALTLKNMGKLEEAESFAYEWRDKSEEMRALYIDFVPEMLAKLDAGKTFPVEKLSRFATQVTAAKSAYGAQSLAWYRMQRKDYAQAATWFRSALDWSGDAKDPKTAEGYTLALRATGQFDLAEQIAYEWRDRADALRTQFIEVFAEALTRTNPPPPFAAERLARYAAIVSTDKSAAGAQALGWYSHNIKQYRPARAWFEKSMQWSPSEGAALGLALSARAMKDNAGFAAIMASYGGTYPKLLEIQQPQAGGRNQTYATTQTGDPVEIVEEVRTLRAPKRARTAAPAATTAPHRSNAACIAEIEAKQRAGVATAQDMVAKGWCLLNADRPQEAAEAFERGRNARGEDAAYGRALSKLKSGETDAAAAIGENVASPKRRNDIGLQVLQQRAVAAQRAGRYVEALHYLDQRAAFAAETRDAAMMRGWALWNLGRKDAARRIFTELDRQLSTQETQSALGVVNDVRGN